MLSECLKICPRTVSLRTGVEVRGWHFFHCQLLQSTAVLAGSDDYTHDYSPRDDCGYNHPPAALLVLNWWTMSLSGGVKEVANFVKDSADRLREIANKGGGGPKSRKICERNKWMPPDNNGDVNTAYLPSLTI